MAFSFDTIKEDKGKELVKIVRYSHIKDSTEKFIAYYNSDAYQKQLDNFFEDNKKICIDILSDERVVSETNRNHPGKITIYLDETYRVYCYGVIFIINQEALELLTFPFDYIMNTIAFIDVEIRNPITCLPPTLHSLYFHHCVMSNNALSKISNTLIDQLTISNNIGIDTLYNVKANYIHISFSDINNIIIHHDYSIQAIDIEDRIDQAKEMYIDIDLPYLDGLHVYNKNEFPTRLHCNFHNTTIGIIVFEQFIICNNNKWTTDKIRQLSFNYCIFESVRAFNFNIIDYIVTLKIERCLFGSHYFSSDKFLSLKGKKVLPKHIYCVNVNTRENEYDNIGYILVRKANNDYPLRIKYVNNEEELCTSYWSEISGKCQKHINDFVNTEFSPVISFDDYMHNGKFIYVYRSRAGETKRVKRDNGSLGWDKVKAPKPMGNIAIGDYEGANGKTLYENIMSVYYHYKVSTIIKKQ